MAEKKEDYQKQEQLTSECLNWLKQLPVGADTH